MLLTLILNLDMAAGLVVPIIPPTGGGGGRRRKPRYKPDYGPIYINDYTKQKKEDEEIINILNAIFENI